MTLTAPAVKSLKKDLASSLAAVSFAVSANLAYLNFIFNGPTPATAAYFASIALSRI